MMSNKNVSKYAWTTAEVKYVRLNYHGTLNKILAMELKAKFGYERSPDTIQKKASEIGLTKINKLVYGQRKEREPLRELVVNGNVTIHRLI